jgi:hypothetical protein
MSETTPPAAEKPSVVNPNQVGRLWTFTIASLSLYGLILTLLVVGAILHHHHHHCHHHHGFDRHHGDFGRFHDRGPGDSERGWHHHEFGPGGGDRDGGEDHHHPGGLDGDENHGAGMHGPGGMMGGPPDPARMTDMVLNHLTQKLSLTDDQKAKIKPIIEDQVAQLAKDMETRRQAMQKQLDDTKAKLKPILNPDQQKKLDELRLPGQRPPPDAASPTPTPKPNP